MQTTRPLSARASAVPPRQVGRYVLLRKIGEGGHGEVFQAYDPSLDRLTAVKLLRGTGNNSALVREARLLARLSHPCIVAAYDVGVHEGQAYLTLELIDGGPLGPREASTDARLLIGALIAAGRGLAEAHRRKIVHGDIKPSNLLIGRDGRIRITDFGVARSLDDPHAALGGTRAYFAPEQHDGEPASFASDQYSFALTMWEALSNEYPWPWTGTDSAPLAATPQAMHRLQEFKRRGAPKWPRPAGVPSTIGRVLLRALGPDPRQRWPSMDAFVDALEAARFPHRRRIAYATAGLAAIAVPAHATWLTVADRLATTRCEDEGRALQTLWSENRVQSIAAAFDRTSIAYASDTWARTRERVDAFADEWETLRNEACLRAERDGQWGEETWSLSRACFDESAAQLGMLLVQWESPDAATVQAAAVAPWDLPNPADCLDAAHLRESEDVNDTEAGAALRRQLAEATALRASGRYELALGAAERAVEFAGRQHDPRLVAAGMLVRGVAHQSLGEFAEAEHDFEQAFASAEESGADQLAFDAAVRLTALVGHRLARPAEGHRWSWLAASKHKRLRLDDADLRSAERLDALSAVHAKESQLDEALPLSIRALEIFETVLGADHPRVAEAANANGVILYEKGMYEQALAAHRRALVIQEAALGPEHPLVSNSLNNICAALTATGARGEALQSCLRALVIREAALGSEHPDLANPLNNIARIHATAGRFDQALSFYERALSIKRRAMGPDHPQIANLLNNIGTVYKGLRRFEDALAHFEQALAIGERTLGPDHPELGQVLMNIGNVTNATGQPGRALEYYRRGLEIFEKQLGPEHDYVARALHNIATVHLAEKRFEQALAAEQRALAIREKGRDEDDPKLADSLSNVADVHLAMGHPERAVPLYERALASIADPERRAELQTSLAAALGQTP